MIQIVKPMLQDLGFSHVWNNRCKVDSHALVTAIRNNFGERFVTFSKKKRILSDETMKELHTYTVLICYSGIESYLDDIY